MTSTFSTSATDSIPVSWDLSAFLRDWTTATPEFDSSLSTHSVSTRKPVEHWVEALPIGNGILGAMSHARPGKITLTANRHDAWSGNEKSPYQDVPAAARTGYLEQVRAAITSGKHEVAQELLMDTQSTHSQAFLPFLDITIETRSDSHSHSATQPHSTGFRHALNFANSTTTSAQTSANEFVAHSTFAPRTATNTGSLVHTISNHGAQPIEVTIALSSMLRAYVGSIGTAHLELPTDVAPTHEDVAHHVTYTSATPRIATISLAAHGWDNTGRTAPADLLWDSSENQPEPHGNDSPEIWKCGRYTLEIPKDSSVALVFTSTPIEELQVGKPSAQPSATRDERATIISQLAQRSTASALKHAQLLAKRIAQAPTQAHQELTAEHRELYLACTLHIEAEEEATRLFNFGRHLLISAYAEKGSPLNLQGLWNHELPPPWSSNYTLNINTPMNYWGAEATSLGALHGPLQEWLTKVVQGPGAHAAKTLYAADGFVLHHNSDLWGHAHPVGAGSGDPCWAYWPMGGIWLTRHMWDHYEYSQDPRDLESIWPIIEAAGQFAQQWMVTTPDGTRTMPSTSPENRFFADSKPFSVTSTVTMDIALIQDLNTYSNAAHTALFGTKAHKPHWLRALNSKANALPAYQIGRNGQIQEWLEDYAEVEPEHRHLSHLVGVYPLGHISPETQPKLAQASATTLTLRGPDSTGWSLAWRISLWAHLNNPAMTADAISRVLRPVEQNSTAENEHRGGLYPNLFAAHPPFQIDGNYGYVAGVVEALAHVVAVNDAPLLKLLPGLPPTWAHGNIGGVRLRGGYLINLRWHGGKPTELELTDTRKSGPARTLTVDFQGHQQTLSTTPTETWRLTAENGRFTGPTPVS